MSPFPKNPAAVRAHRKTLCITVDKGRHQVSGPRFRQIFQIPVAVDAPGKRTDLFFQLEFMDHLGDLLAPILALDKKDPWGARFREDPRIPGQQNPAFIPGKTDEIFILDFGEVNGVETEDLEPLGQLSEHTVDGKFHSPNLTAPKS